MRVDDLPSGSGVEISDVRLSQPLSGPEVRELRSLFEASHLLLFKGQDLTSEQHDRVIGYLGERSPTASGEIEDIVDNRSTNVTGLARLLFHSDGSFTPTPTVGMSLYGIELSSDAPATQFASTVEPLRRLDDDVLARIESLITVQLLELSEKQEYVRIREHLLPDDVDMAGYLRAEHPVVITLPNSGTKALFVSQGQTSHLVGLPLDESEELIHALWSELYAPRNVYTHHWQVGDLIVWSNLAIQHARPGRVGDAPRRLRRIAFSTVYSAEESLPTPA